MIERALKIFIALMAAAAAAAQDAPPAPVVQTGIGAAKHFPEGPDTHDASSIVLAPRPAPTVPVPGPDSSNRSVSPGIAAVLAAAMPKYRPEPTPPKAAADAQDRRDVDRPRNLIPRLPVEVMSRYVVREARLPEFRERDLHTAAKLINLSFKDHPGLHFGNFFNLNAGFAYAMYLDQERLEEKEGFEDTAYAMAVGGDPAEAKAIMDATRDAFMRSDDHSGPVGIK